MLGRQQYYRNNTSRRKIAEALFIKQMKPSLNIQDKSLSLSYLTNVCFRSTFSWRLLLSGNQLIHLHCISIISIGWLLHNRSFYLKVFLNGHSHCFCLYTPETSIWNDLFIVVTYNLGCCLSSTLLSFIWTCHYH